MKSPVEKNRKSVSLHKYIRTYLIFRFFMAQERNYRIKARVMFINIINSYTLIH